MIKHKYPPLISYRPELQTIINVVCRINDVTVEDVKSAVRLEKFTKPRFMVSHIIRMNRPEVTLSAVKDLYGLKNHTAILYHQTECEALYSTDKQFNERYNTVVAELEKLKP